MSKELRDKVDRILGQVASYYDGMTGIDKTAARKLMLNLLTEERRNGREEILLSMKVRADTLKKNFPSPLLDSLLDTLGIDELFETLNSKEE